MIFKEHKGVCFSVSLRTKTDTATLLRNYALETYPSNTHARGHTHTRLSIKNFKMVADISFTRRLKAFPITRRINLPEDSGTADVYCGKILKFIGKKNHFWTPAARNNGIIVNRE